MRRTLECVVFFENIVVGNGAWRSCLEKGKLNFLGKTHVGCMEGCLIKDCGAIKILH